MLTTPKWLALAAATVIFALMAPVAAGNGATLLLGAMVATVIATRPRIVEGAE